MKPKERNIWYAKIITLLGFDLNRSWFSYEQKTLGEIDELAEAMHVKGSQGRCPGRTLWDRAKEGRPF